MRLPAFDRRWGLGLVSSRRGRWIVVALAAVSVLLIALGLGVPRVAESRVRDRLEALGLDFTAGGSAVDLGRLRFEDVSIRSRASQARVAQLGSLNIELSWLRALSSPLAAIGHVRAAHVEVELGIDELSQLLQLYRSRPAREPGSAGSEPAVSKQRPPISLEDVRLKLRDGVGPLFAAQLPKVMLDDASWKAELTQVEIGSAPGEFASFEDIVMSGPRTEQRPQLGSAQVGAATLVWSSPEGDDPNRTRLGLVDRIRNARTALSGDRAPDTTAATGQRTALWTPDARIELRGARVLDGPGTSGTALLERLNLDLLAEGETSIRVKGDGVTPASGSVFWDLHVVPGEAKVEGRVTLRAVPMALFAPVLPSAPFHELEHTRVAADLSITGQGLESAALRGELSISDLAFASEGLARAPVGPLSFTARGQAIWTPARRELSELRGELASGAARVLVTGALAWPKDAYRVDLQAELPKLKCQAVLDVVPPSLLDELSEIELTGTIKAKVGVHVDSADLPGTQLDFDFVDRCRFRNLPDLMNVSQFSQPFEHRVLEPDGTMFEMETGPGTPAWTPIEEISPFMIQAVVASEDGRFFGHHGFAETQIGPALARDLEAHAFKFGASTITMQLVKNVFLHRDKLLARKAQEAFIVWWLEQKVDKRWILELYLNVIEYGPSIYGIRAAALHYFGTLPIQLTPAQAAFLATVLPGPKAYDKQYLQGTLKASTKKRIASFLKHMRSRNRIDDEALAYGLEELASFKFYRSTQPLPAPPEVRGAALAPPFQTGPIEGWNTFEAPAPSLRENVNLRM